MTNNVKFTNNSKLALSELKSKEKLALTAIGEKWRSIVTKEITTRKIVDTGRLRGSMNFKVNTSDKTVEVGSPVEYALKNEMDNPKGPYLKPSILDYKESYKNIAEAILKK